MSIQNLTILGSTGSIGESTLDVVARHPDRFSVFALAGHTQVEKLAAQCRRFQPEYAVAAERAPFAYALAMVIERGDDFRLTLETDDGVRQPENYFGALDWIRFLLSGCEASRSRDSLKHTRQYANRRWLWEKRA